MTSTEFGVQYDDGRGHTYASPFCDEETAASFVRDHSTRDWHPRPVRVVQRLVDEWAPVEAVAAAGPERAA